MIFLLPAFQFALRAILRWISSRMPGMTIGETLDQGRPLAAPRLVKGLLHGPIDDVGVLSIDSDLRQAVGHRPIRSEEHTSELQSIMRISYAVFCLNKKQANPNTQYHNQQMNEQNIEQPN